jgi:hypothetical protein
MSIVFGSEEAQRYVEAERQACIEEQRRKRRDRTLLEPGLTIGERMAELEAIIDEADDVEIIAIEEIEELDELMYFVRTGRDWKYVQERFPLAMRGDG